MSCPAHCVSCSGRTPERRLPSPRTRTGCCASSLTTGHGWCSVPGSAAVTGSPAEIQLLEFPSAAALDAYMGDPRRTVLAADRDRAVARTEILEVELIPPHS